MPCPFVTELQLIVSDSVRAMIEEKVKANGGEYVADLSKRVTHLIVYKPEGKKYNAARKWNIRCVSIEWLHDSVERGMILDEDCYDPTLPQEERGKGAWSRRDFRRVSLGKRTREGGASFIEEGRRKLRKSASMRMNSQSNNIWGDILNQSAGDLSRTDDPKRESSAPMVAVADLLTKSETVLPITKPSRDSDLPAVTTGVFSGCRFFVHGFPEKKKQVLFEFLTSHGGQLATSLEDVASSSHGESSSQRYLLVPQSSQPESHPRLSDGVHIITEFFIERCIHNKRLFSPTDHVWGQPFPRFPIDEFHDLTICTAGFVDEQLNQVEKTITQLGATYSEKLNRLVSLLVCPDLRSLRDQKRDLAIYHNIPIVNVEWLWQCITTGCLVPWERFQFEELVRTADALRANLRRKEDKKRGRQALNRSRSEPVLAQPRPKTNHRAPPPRAGVDMTAFDTGMSGTDRQESTAKKDAQESHYETAPTHHTIFDNAFATTPLSEATANNLNKPTSPIKQPVEERKLKRFPTGGEIGDSEAGEESDATTQTGKESADCNLEAKRNRSIQEAKDSERLEMSKRLNSLMSSDTASLESDAVHLQQGSRPAHRKRQILGRAISNVSAASSASADSTMVPAPRIRQTVQTLSEGGGSELDKFLEDGANENMAEYNPPPATQVEYDNPEARKHRQVVMDRLLGNKRTSVSESRKQTQNQEKIFKASDLDPRNAMRRTTRRQGRE